MKDKIYFSDKRKEKKRMEELEKKDVIAKSLLELEYYPVVKN